MRVLPDDARAIHERTAACEALTRVLDRVASAGDDGSRPAVAVEALMYPGMFAAAYDAQAAAVAGRRSPRDDRWVASLVCGAVERAAGSALRATHGGCPSWPVDLAPAEAHLRAGLARAVAQVPQRPDRVQALAAVRIGAWSDPACHAFCDAACLLADTWPAMLAELRVVVQQVALIDGFGIDGFTDVATHGAIYVNSARLRDAAAGLPGPVRLAEALVHEGAHNRCNAAALTDPFLADPRSGREPLVMTPLRTDPRPLSGLLQQLVVLVRSVLLYDRLVSRAPTEEAAAVRSRGDKLRDQAAQALRAIAAHTGKLTEHGRAVVTQSGELLAGSGRSDELAFD